MRSLARVLLERGCVLSGSDLAPEGAAAFASEGVPLYRGHVAGHVRPDVQLVVFSDAVGHDNPELAEARRREIPAKSYFDVAGQLTAEGRALAVAGTHGKSTTTAMAAHVLVDAGLDPTVLCGAAPRGRSDGGRAGSGRLVVVEACEYRENFLKLHPAHAVLLGVEPDHFDCFDTSDALNEAFGRFVARLPAEGLLLAAGHCPVTQYLAAGAACPVETFGLLGADEPADWTARIVDHRLGRYRFVLARWGEELCEVALRMPGVHNVRNATAAAALAWHSGVAPARIARSLGAFAGLHRRQEIVGVRSGVVYVDDYAHHPTEVCATLRAVRQMYPARRLVCVFQPHQASRTGRLLDELARSLQNVDKLWVADVFRAREGAPQAGEATAADLVRRVRQRGGRAGDVHAIEAIGRELENCLAAGDVLVTLGAGDIRRICDGFLDGLRVVREAG
ncbi:MAG: UDP-N-acetylmuramate--L-alanine ligase [Pirellulales bacterium]|nr:UDP-N-acetylmuramate--L-alanine ligase [Pirellulales bacterium]